MNILEIIDKKRLKEELTSEEIEFAFNGFLNGEIEDYQMSSLLMAIVLNGMSDEEIYALTDVFINSGDILDLSSINGIKIDKHSTGGIGDKTTIVVGPIVASIGVPVCKMSGRGLGYTGGTIDKLESIPGFNVNLSDEEMIEQVNKIGIALSSQTKNLAPLDKKVYALRDVTGTTQSIPLIASSIMCKKIASGADKILIDIKIGSGALLSNKEDADHLSDLMIKIGKKYGKEVRTVTTDMNTPLGSAIGNSLEIVEAISILRGHGKGTYLYDVCVELATNMVSMGLNISMKEAEKKVIEAIENGSAFDKFNEWIKYQGGRINELRVSEKDKIIRSKKNGVIKSIDALEIGKLSFYLGSSKVSKEDTIDYNVGVVLHKSVGDKVNIGDPLCTIYMGDKSKDVDPYKAFVIK